MNLTEEIKKRAVKTGFVCAGIISPKMFKDLPHGWIANVINLLTPEEELKEANSVILLGYYAWDKSLNLAVDSDYIKHRKKYTPKVPTERYQFYYEVLKNKAWPIVHYLTNKGYKASFSLSIPLKTAAVKCGLGSQGKNTLLITPNYGPRIRLIAIITTAKLEEDKQFKSDLCGNCTKCLDACPTKALEPYKIKINRCLTYAAEQPKAKNVPEDVPIGRLNETKTNKNLL
jgi:epoxyqueuosine reductase